MAKATMVMKVKIQKADGSDPEGEEGGIGVEGSVEMDVGRVLEAGDADLTGVHDPCVE